MSEQEQEYVPTEEELQAARDSTPERPEDNLDLTPEGEEPAPVSAPAVEETAASTEQESGSEAVNAEGEGPDSQDYDPS